MGWQTVKHSEVQARMHVKYRCAIALSLSLSFTGLLLQHQGAIAQTSPVAPTPDTLPNPDELNVPDAIEQITPRSPSTTPLPIEPPAPSPSPILQPPAEETPPPPTIPAVSIPVTRIEVEGNTVLEDEIVALIQPLENQTVTFEDLVSLRSAITQLYIENGYITSGAFLPNNQDLTDGVVRIQVLEGTLERLTISGLDHLRDAYVRDRINRATSTPLNQNRLEEALQLLQLNPLIRRVNAELTVGSAPGRSALLLDVEEAPAFHAGVGGDNYQSPSVGSEQLSGSISHDNLLGFGDRLSVGYGITEGLDSFDASYSIPFNALDGTFSVSYNTDESLILEEDFDDLGIRSEAETWSFNVRQPLFKSPTHEFALGLGLDLRRSQTFILDDIPFSFSEGPENGESRVSVLRFSQDWLQRDARTVLAARSQLSIGLDAFDATVNSTGTDSRFVAWLGQFQWVQQVSPRLLFVTRLNAQLTPDSLLSLERFGFGGVDTVRGYAQNQLVTDNGVLASIEARLPLTDDTTRLQLIPFLDIGHGWNNRTPDPEEATLASLGLGVRWLITPDLLLRADYGIPLIEVDNSGNSLQENGVYFSLRYQPF